MQFRAQWFNHTGELIQLRPIPASQCIPPVLPCAQSFAACSAEYEITIQVWESGYYRIEHRHIRLTGTSSIKLEEHSSGFRIEAISLGVLQCSSGSNIETRVKQGYYQVSDIIKHHFNTGEPQSFTYFVLYYPEQLLIDFGIPHKVEFAGPHRIPQGMLNAIEEIMDHTNDGFIADLYYRKLLVECMCIHLDTAAFFSFDTMTMQDIDAIYAAERILTEDLAIHHTIKKLSGLAGTNTFKLKKGFRIIFKMGVYQRLLFRRMEKAKTLLTNSNRSIKEIAYECGYATVAGFITAFRKIFGTTPLEWRSRHHKR